MHVENWTKNVNIFEKDYLIIPINEKSHWFLAIICFPGLEGIKVLPKEKKSKHAFLLCPSIKLNTHFLCHRMSL